MMSDPKKPGSKQTVINVDPGTLLAIVAVLLLVPLLITGFWAQ